MRKIMFIGIGVILLGVIVSFSLVTTQAERKAESPSLSQSKEDEYAELAIKGNSTLIKRVSEGLNDYKEIGDIGTQYGESLTVNTSISSSNKDANAIAKEIQTRVKEILKSKELESISNISNYKIYVKNKDGEIIN